MDPRRRTPHNKPLNKAGRLTSPERSFGPVAEEPRESLVLFGLGALSSRLTLSSGPRRLWDYPLCRNASPFVMLGYKTQQESRATLAAPSGA